MLENQINDPILEMFIFETVQQLEQLELNMLQSEKENSLNNSMNEIFRIMHTLKGNSGMMNFNNISNLAHCLEDLFDYLRQHVTIQYSCSKITDLVFLSLDFIKEELEKVKIGKELDGEEDTLVKRIKEYLLEVKEEHPAEEKKRGGIKYKVHLYFQEGCQMENIRAFAIIHNIGQTSIGTISFYPLDIVESDESAEVIKREGFRFVFKSELDLQEVEKLVSKIAFIEKSEIGLMESSEEEAEFLKQNEGKKVIREVARDSEKIMDLPEAKKETSIEELRIPSLNEVAVLHNNNTSVATVLTVSISKLDRMMDLMGELVISESMVTNNPLIQKLHIDSFSKASRQHRKIIHEMQDLVMSVRMVSLAATFQKMNRLVRDVSKKLLKEVELEIIGQDTEVDKNIIESISDPIVHIIRNALDHGIECTEERLRKGKSKIGKIILEAKNEGGEVWITIRDNGAGLNKEKILKKAKDHGLVFRAESELTEKEIYSFIFLPGFSTNDQVTELSGRGVGMDIVSKNVEKIRGSIVVDSIEGEGTAISIKIPLTLAIIDGMNVKVGNSRYTIPITYIKESLRIAEKDLITDLSGNEMILLRGECYPVIRLCELYKVKNAVTKMEKGILVLVQEESRIVCIFVDALLGQQQVVVKALPTYIKKVRGIGGCTLLGDGNISLILDVNGIFSLGE